MEKTVKKAQSYCKICCRKIGNQKICQYCGAQSKTDNRNAHNAIILRQKYLLCKELRRDEIYITYLGIDLIMDKTVVIKKFFYHYKENSTSVLLQEAITEQELLEKEKMIKKIKKLKQLSEANDINIAKIYDIFEAYGTFYIVVEHLEIQNLEDLVKERGHFSEDEAITLAIYILGALKKIHQHGFLVKNINPSQLYRKEDGEIVFSHLSIEDSILNKGKGLGCFNCSDYSAPEQFRSQKQGPWTDNYGVGATIYKLVTGQNPPNDFCRSRKQESLNLSHLRNGLASLLSKSMSINIQDRPQSAEELQDMFFMLEMMYAFVDEKDIPLINYERLKELYQELCLSKTEGCCEVGMLYEYGNLCICKLKEDYYKAMQLYQKECFSKAAESYRKGKGVLQDYGKAIEFYQKSCSNHEMDSCIQLAELYIQGKVITKDYGKAAEYYKKACRNNVFHACAKLGVLYETGHGVSQNYNKALTLFRRACEHNDLLGCINLALFYEKGYLAPKNDLKIERLLLNACRTKNMNHCINIATTYEHDRAFPKDYYKAKRIYEELCRRENMRGCTYLGLLYLHGHGVEKNYQKAKTLYEKACNKGFMLACNRLAKLYQYGHYEPKDYHKAKALYEKSCKEKDNHGCLYLGILYEYGLGVSVNHLKAAEYFQKACDDELYFACYKLAQLYEYRYSMHIIQIKLLSTIKKLAIKEMNMLAID